MNLFFVSVLGGLALFSLTSFIRYILLYRSKRVKGLEKVNFPSYDIGNLLKESRKPKLDTKRDVTQTLNISNPDTSKITPKHRDLPITPVIGDSMLIGANVFYQYMCIDDHTYEGISRLSGENIDNFSDLSAKLETYAHDSQGLTEGALNKLKGHVAESHVAKHFEETGVEAVWPEASNQEGWDLLLNGNQVNVKLVNDANNLLAHFKEHPEIPVVIPSDADSIPETAFHFDPSEGIDHLFDYLKDNPENAVIVNEQLSYIGIEENLEAGTDLALGVDEGIPGFNFPLITTAVSGWREINLLEKGDTDIESAIKNAGLDIAGVGVGAGIGMAIGTAILPGIGTAAGGFLGSMIGREVTKDIKLIPFKDAQKVWKKAVKEFKQKAQKSAVKYKQQFNQSQKIEQSNLDQQALRIKDTINHDIRNLRKRTIEREKPSIKLRKDLLRNISNEVMHIQLNWIDYFWPSSQTIVYIRKLNAIKSLRQQIESNPHVDRASLFEMCAKEGLCRSYILFEIERIEEGRKIHENQLIDNIKEKQKTLLDQRLKSMKKLSSKVTEYTTQIRKELLPYIHQVKNSQNYVQKEALKLGKDIEKAKAA